MAYVQLFGSGSLYDTGGRLAGLLGKAAGAVAQRLQGWDPDDLLNTPVDDVVEYLVDLGSVECPQLLVDEAYQLEPAEVEQQFVNFGRVHTRCVVRFVLVVPFVGLSDVFTLQADMSTWSPPQVLRLEEGALHLVLDDPPSDPAATRKAFEDQIAEIEKYLGWSRSQIDSHNRHVGDEVPSMVGRRREQLLAMRNLQASVGFPVRRRPDADRYVIPTKRKTMKPRRPEPSGARAPFKPEPTLPEQDYKDALRVLRNTRNQLERNPSVAAKLKEEEIRDILLMGLNSHFQGTAGGELFNGEGKTDILIREDDRNVFIGECKVWSGPRTMDEALDQLFRYLVWRDTKAAILLFIRRKDVTAIIEKAVAKIEEHPNCKRSRPRRTGDEEFEFTVHAQDDVNREIRLTLMPFALRSPRDQMCADQ
ncbi:hypothetical protein [Mycobacteroides salmoniphilum]|uniref:hypothetical protein n=1 Tax=Mycobacteroides salmoniphilum TaxID=404941 RepID=UPI0009928DE4|nr:hypothetical protein [Mycobacteroides salmoniphilum]